MVGCYSGKPLNTQNIDSLAAEGIRFNSAYTCSPVCTPARAGLFTGIYANQSPRGPTTSRQAKTSPLWGATLRMPAITPVTSANGISTVMTISALASVRRSGTLITGSMGRTILAN
nr:sulfatase-like hydrolase/transferase [Escherichia coli]